MPRSLVLPAILIATIFTAIDPKTSIAQQNGQDSAQQNAQIDFFESRIRPVLIERCYHCHNSSGDAQADLAIDYRDGLRNGVDEPLIVPGKPAKSRLIAILKHQINGLEMPEDSGKLSDAVIADFETWIKDGAHDPRDKPPSADDLAKATSWDAKLAKRKKWWSFQPIKDPPTPSFEPGVQERGGSFSGWHLSDNLSARSDRNAKEAPESPASPRALSHRIDRFVAAKLIQNQLQPAAPAEPHIIIRRTHFALIGLPPEPDEISRWTKALTVDHNAGMAAMVDHLLARPEFGERWARHWMDWIRYAESHGSEGDPRIDNAHLYRDYLIRALNADVPYDQLVREHIAGDLLQQPRTNDALGINESIIGPAHWRMVFHGFAPTDVLEEKVRFTDDQINTFSKAFLGLTVSCARCHDHKFDAISQKDYYALFGILGSTRPARAVIDVESKVHKHREELQRLKTVIRNSLSSFWSKSASAEPGGSDSNQTPAAMRGLRTRLLKDDSLWKNAKQPVAILHPWYRLKQQVQAGREFKDAWQQLVDDWKAKRKQREAFAKQSLVRRWQFSSPSDYAKWFPRGAGLPQQPQPAGTFAVGSDAKNFGVYPAGVYSHAISSRHSARLTSPIVQLDNNYDLWVRAIGGNGAAVRYVVQNYPRNGTVFPVRNLTNRWQWHRFSLKYWEGDEIHVEVTNGKDAPLLVKNTPRSWFGVREVVIAAAGTRPPTDDDWEWFDPLFQLAESRSVGSFDDLADCYMDTVARTISAWQAGSMTDAQALLLDQCRTTIFAPAAAATDDSLASIASYRKLESEIAEPVRVPGLDETTGRNQPLLTRGDHRKPTDAVPRRFLEAIDATPYDTKQSGRRELAEDVLRNDNPLSRRVIVNRVWHHLFGQGIVNTPDNFGAMGDTPSHPELLDHLASRFASDHRWSLQSLIRSIVLSRTWQLSSVPSTAANERDPENRFLSHANIRRLEAEAIRDAMLSVSGQLDRRQFGPSVNGNASRRSVYVRVIRNSLDPFLRAFDFPEPFSATGRRDVTNVPAQSLMLMNDAQVNRLASAWADRTLEVKPGPVSLSRSRIDFMFHTAFARAATSEDVDRITQYMLASKQQLVQQRQQLIDLQSNNKQLQQRIAAIVEPVRTRLVADAKAGNIAPTISVPKPVHRWDFESNAQDVVGTAHAELRGGATIQDGALIVRNGGHAVTGPLKHGLKEKTLEVWVQLDNLNQRAGGVITVQTPNGVNFDSIVYAERDARRWLSGSNNFARTQPFAAGPAEDTADKQPVHLAICYHKDGRIVGYRNGRPYGDAYQTNGPNAFGSDAIVSFGLRHLPAGGNRLLSGRILTAQIYDRALSAAEIEATSKAAPFFVSEAAVLAQLSEQQREEISDFKSQTSNLQSQIEALGQIPDPQDERTQWRNLARAMLTFKEFIYVR